MDMRESWTCKDPECFVVVSYQFGCRNIELPGPELPVLPKATFEFGKELPPK